MLSAETAVGDFPVDVVQTMRRICEASDKHLAELKKSKYSQVKRVFQIKSAATTFCKAADQISEDVIWLNEDATEMIDEDWLNAKRHHFGVLFNGDHMDEVDEEGNLITSSTLLILCNAYWEDIDFVLPPHKEEEYARNLAVEQPDKCWKLLLDTSGIYSSSCWELNSRFLVSDRSLVLFELSDKDENLPYSSISGIQV